MKRALIFLNDSELENNFISLAQKERELLNEVILHIQEIDRRKLYLRKAFPSLFSYLTEELKYSAAAAQRRIEAARLAKQIPEIAQKIHTGELSLSSIGEIQRAVKIKEQALSSKVPVETKKALISASLGQSAKITQEICSKILNIPAVHIELERRQQDQSHQLTITLTAEQFEKLQQTKGLLASTLLKNGNSSISATIEKLCDLYLEKKIASKKLIDENLYPSAISKRGNAIVMNSSTSAAEMKNLKTLTPKTKAVILNRDRCCQWRDHKTGRTCGSLFNLQIDHKKPQWAGGSHKIENLQVLCQRHNLFRYETGK